MFHHSANSLKCRPQPCSPKVRFRRYPRVRANAALPFRRNLHQSSIAVQTPETLPLPTPAGLRLQDHR